MSTSPETSTNTPSTQETKSWFSLPSFSSNKPEEKTQPQPASASTSSWIPKVNFNLFGSKPTEPSQSNTETQSQVQTGGKRKNKKSNKSKKSKKSSRKTSRKTKKSKK